MRTRICGRDHRFTDRGISHQQHPRCTRPRIRECLRCGFRALARCRSTARRVCVPCSETYRRCIWQIALSGFLIVGRGQQLFLTLTAPGSEQHADTVHGGICPCTPEGGVALPVWNAQLPRRWNRFMQALRRHVGTKLSYFRAIETQKRGALHEHVILARADGQPLILSAERVRQLAMQHGYGHSIRLDVVSSMGGASSYVSKYVSKACDDRPDVPWVDESTGELMRARYRPWSSSRDWGMRMRDVLAVQAAWARAHDEPLDNNTKNYTHAHDAGPEITDTGQAILAEMPARSSPEPMRGAQWR
jgi:hypothetical protein